MLYLPALAATLLAFSSAAFDPTDVGADPDFPAFERFIATYRGGRAYSSEAEMLGRFGVSVSVLLILRHINNHC